MLTYTKFHDVYTIICRCVQRRTPDHGHICLQEKLTELTLKSFARPFEKRGLGIRKRKKNGNCKVFCITRKRNNQRLWKIFADFPSLTILKLKVEQNSDIWFLIVLIGYPSYKPIQKQPPEVFYENRCI